MKKWVALLLVTVLLTFSAASLAEGASMLVRAGGSFGIALAADGSIWGWGDNASGQLGNGTNKRSYFPTPAALEVDGTQVLDIACGNVSTLFLMLDGTVLTCGRNNYGQQGYQGRPDYVFKPQPIEGLKNIIKIACGFGQCMALDQNGHVWVWGRNSNGQLGNGKKKNVGVPFMLELENITDIQCGGKFCYAMAKDGTLYGWGDNEFGQLGDLNRYRDVTTPTELPMSHRFVSVAAGGDVGYGIDAEGVTWAWGRNDYYQLGNKSVHKKSAEPVRVALPEGTVAVRLFAYSSHAGIITDGGALWQWGAIFHGQVGDGKRPWRDVPRGANPTEGVHDMAVGSLQSYLLLEDGSLYGCGGNEYGQTGAFRRVHYYVDRWMNTGLNLKTAAWENPKND